MATEDVKILHIEGVLTALSNKQIGVDSKADDDLGFRMWGGKDNAGNVTQFLAKSENAWIDELRLEGETTIGDIGMLKHDANGDITGGKISVDYFNTNILSDGPIAGGDIDGSGTANTLAMFTDTDTIGDSTITKSSNIYSVNGESSSHGGEFTNGLVINQLEVNGHAHFDNIVFMYSEIHAYGDMTFHDDTPLYFGTSEDVHIEWDTNQTPDALMVGLGSDSNSLMLCQKADIGTDYALGLYTDPTLVLKAAGTTAAERTELSHGLANVASGDYRINANNWILDFNPDSMTLTGGSPEACVLAGESHTINSMYAHHTAVFGEGNDVNGSHCLVSGDSNTQEGYGTVLGGVTNTSAAAYCGIFGSGHELSYWASYSLVGGDSVTVTDDHNLAVGNTLVVNGHHNAVSGFTNSTASDYTALFGRNNTVDGSSDFSLVCGQYNEIEDADGALVSGTANEVTAGYGLTFGTSCVNEHDSAIVHGAYAKSSWNMGRFFSTVRLDGSTTGISQCFDTTMFARHTESTDTVMLTRDGTGSTHPISVPEGSHVSFLLSVHAAYEAAGNGYLHRLYFITISNSNADIPRVASTTIATNEGGTYGFTFSWSYDEGTDCLAFNVTPGNAAAANIVAHIFGGIKLKSEHSCS